jgi:hypothetical protein
LIFKREELLEESTREELQKMRMAKTVYHDDGMNVMKKN